MTLQYPLVAIFLSIGAVQGLVYGTRLFQKKEEPKIANQLLAYILFFLSYRLLIQVLRLFGLGRYDTWYYFMIDLSWINAPLLYFYVKASLDHSFQWKKKHLWHLLPFGLQIGFSIFVRLQNLYWDGTRESLSWLGYWGYAIWMNLSTIYFVASILILVYTQKALVLLRQHKAGLELGHGNWLRRMMQAFQYYFALVLAVLVIDLFVIEKSKLFSYFYFTRFYYYPFFVGMAVLNYWLGFSGYHKNFGSLRKPKKVISKEDEGQLILLGQKLEKRMREEKLFRDPELSLGSLAEILKVKPYQLSRCLSHVLNIKFNDYVNTLRAQEVQRLAQLPENNRYTLLSLAYEAGFNSKSSFQRAIRKHLGVIPSQLRTGNKGQLNN